ncbi:MAG: hypothetical protein ABT940_01465, partial [Alphaproteobacteria bacterium]
MTLRNPWRCRQFILHVLLAVGLVVFPAWAEPPTRQVLRLETGMHRAPILRIDTDAAGTRLATVSEDGTARLWSLADNTLLRTFRTPIGTGGPERLSAVALSPDASLLAMAGSRSGEEALPSLYLFDTRKGRLVRRLRDLPNRVHHLAFSPDGRYLAAALAGRAGLRIFKSGNGGAGDWSLAASDGGYAADSFWVQFDGRGRLATTSIDGTVRLYGPDLHLLTKSTVSRGKHPYGLAFSPDGQHLAVGYVDSTQVDVLSGETLSLQFTPDSTSATNGTLNSVAWSDDGRVLLAGGRYQNPAGLKLVRMWRESGRGPATDVPATQGTIMAVQTLKNGGMVIGAADPVIHVVPTEDAEAVQIRNGLVSFRGIEQRLVLSADGRRLGFPLDPEGRHTATFDPGTTGLLIDPPPGQALSPPRMSAAGVTVGDWQSGRRRPSVNGHVLPLEDDEAHTSLAMAKNRRVVLGTSRRLRMFDEKGIPVWQQLAPGAVWGVNAAEDGKLLVAAYGDGTLRWHRQSDGQELLALLPYDNGRRWVTWTPGGYYQSSADGDELLGWQIDNGRENAPDFLSVSRFADAFRRPDIVARVLDTRDEAQ